MIRISALFFICITFIFGEIKNIKSFEAEFTQILHSQNDDIVYKGKIKSLAPHYVLWDYSSPITKQIYIQRDSMIIYEPRLKQAIISSLQENLDILSLIKSAKKIKDNLYESTIMGQKYNLTFKDGILNSITFEDSLQNQVEIKFSQIKVDSSIEPHIFEFKPTSDIDIIYN